MWEVIAAVIRHNRRPFGVRQFDVAAFAPLLAETRASQRRDDLTGGHHWECGHQRFSPPSVCILLSMPLYAASVCPGFALE